MHAHIFLYLADVYLLRNSYTCVCYTKETPAIVYKTVLTVILLVQGEYKNIFVVTVSVSCCIRPSKQ